jgi:hypothetical protein
LKRQRKSADSARCTHGKIPPGIFWRPGTQIFDGFVKIVRTPGISQATQSETLPPQIHSSDLLADMCAGPASKLYYPKANRGANLVSTNAAVGLAGRIGTNLVRKEFSKHVMTNVSGKGRQ